jgi:hypothetical protein
MTKVAINRCFGGFRLSQEALSMLNEDLRESIEQGKTLIYRSDPALVDVIEKLGPAASSTNSNIIVVQVPDDVEWYIEEYDGLEHVAEHHRIWLC